MPTMEEIRREWQGVRSAIGTLVCYIDGKVGQVGEDGESWQKGYDSGYKDGMKAGIASVETDARIPAKAKWAEVHIDFAEDWADMQIASMLCDNCHRWHNEVYHYGNPIEFANYCPHCGAKMKEA